MKAKYKNSVEDIVDDMWSIGFKGSCGSQRVDGVQDVEEECGGFKLLTADFQSKTGTLLPLLLVVYFILIMLLLCIEQLFKYIFSPARYVTQTPYISHTVVK